MAFENMIEKLKNITGCFVVIIFDIFLSLSPFSIIILPPRPEKEKVRGFSLMHHHDTSPPVPLPIPNTNPRAKPTFSPGAPAAGTRPAAAAAAAVVGGYAWTVFFRAPVGRRWGARAGRGGC